MQNFSQKPYTHSFSIGSVYGKLGADKYGDSNPSISESFTKI
jgi:hypothetical protein